MNGFTVDPAGLSSVASTLEGLAQELSAGLDELRATVTTNSPWGADEPGSLFGAAYVEVLGQALATYASHVGELAQAAEGLTGWADTVISTDRAQAATVTAIVPRAL